MIVLKVCLLVMSVILLIMSILVLFFKKDNALLLYKEHLKEGMIRGDYTKCIGTICFVYSLAFISLYICSLIPTIDMSLELFLWLSLGSIMLFLLTLTAFILVRALFKKNN